jgi:hypothetical protein
MIYLPELLINTMATRRRLSGLAHYSTPVMHAVLAWAVPTHSTSSADDPVWHPLPGTQADYGMQVVNKVGSLV